jgi:Spy/CpxP family protein refolding chaperone
MIITLVCCASVSAQDPQQPPQNSPQQAVSDPIEQLRLTPEQRQKIRAIRESTRLERAQTNQRLREANFALNKALDDDVLDEALIEQRLREAAAAQAASMRMRVQTEVQIRRVLTQEQVATLRALRQPAGRPLNADQNQNTRPNRQGNVLRPNQRNGIAPVFPRRDAPRNPRP